MPKHNRFFLPLLVTACFTISVCTAAEAQAQGSSVTTVKGGQWSDQSTWSGGSVPEAGDKVTISDGMDVVLDVSPPALGGMTISGKLSFADESDLNLRTEWIMVHGELQI